MNRRRFLTSLAGATAAFAITPVVLRQPGASGLLHVSGAGDDPGRFSGKATFERLLKTAQENDWHSLPIGELIATVGLELRGVPYQASTLEIEGEPEECTIDLLGLDCVTFFENALAFARMLKFGGSTTDDMLAQVRLTRYYDGRVDGYASRIHYTSDWLIQNEKKGVVDVVTPDLPHAAVFDKTIDFMSTHPNSYQQLREDPALVDAIAKVERRLNAERKYYLPKQFVADDAAKLRTGDIVGITTTVPGIDCAHTGLIYRDPDGTVRFLHASTTHKQVYLDGAFSDYLQSVSKDTGIMVARAREVEG